ncbi:uncharacterized protein BCR38DRAFT_72308 [Pseudomassariella vexata]|uniref:Uncharacterized protein n=1 Tax=Pseudomassariella vexata TaxID=1141098 RepID=A0A1Y2DIG2_9PEZI|nr:uncharacterized protein BCR38DRAFT_72308 [Pseudomassariella vexata]ORY58924.1 hypothetical protein BCR38DRAFT_72308 [Pseudomassariella vexata]
MSQINFGDPLPGASSANPNPRAILLQIQQQQEQILQVLEDHTRRLEELNQVIHARRWERQQGAHSKTNERSQLPPPPTPQPVQHAQHVQQVQHTQLVQQYDDRTLQPLSNGLDTLQQAASTTDHDMTSSQAPEDPDISVMLYKERPPVPSGTRFPSYQALLDGVKAHEQRLGYATVIAHSDLKPKKGKARVYFGCVHSGKSRKGYKPKIGERAEQHATENSKKRHYKDRASKKTNCPFKFSAVALGPPSGGVKENRVWLNCPWEVNWDESKDMDCAKHNHLNPDHES